MNNTTNLIDQVLDAHEIAALELAVTERLAYLLRCGACTHDDDLRAVIRGARKLGMNISSEWMTDDEIEAAGQ